MFKLWNDVYDYLLNAKAGSTVKLPKNTVLPKNFIKTSFGFSEGCIEQYRDNLRNNSLHVRVYENYTEVHMDKINPKYDFLGHFFEDFSQIVKSPTFQITALALAAGLYITTQSKKA